MVVFQLQESFTYDHPLMLNKSSMMVNADESLRLSLTSTTYQYRVFFVAYYNSGVMRMYECNQYNTLKFRRLEKAFFISRSESATCSCTILPIYK